jgi:transcription initiation factor TFIIB
MMKSATKVTSIAMFDTNPVTRMANKDGLGNSLSSKTKEVFFRLKRLNGRSFNGRTGQTLRTSLSLLNALRIKLGLPDSLAENAGHLYRKAKSNKIRIVMNNKNLMCACIYIACKKQGVPRSILEISLVSNIAKKEIARACRTVVERMEISLVPFNPSEFLTKIANEAKISEKSRRFAIDILEIAKNAKITDGKNPKALAAASLYLSCVLNNEKKSQAQLAKASGISINTVRTRYCELRMNIF